MPAAMEDVARLEKRIAELEAESWDTWVNLQVQNFLMDRPEADPKLARAAVIIKEVETQRRKLEAALADAEIRLAHFEKRLGKREVLGDE